MEWLDAMVEVFDVYYDLIALLAVCYLAFRLKSPVAFVVLGDFALTFFGQNWIKSLELWGGLGLDYHYVLGIKDAFLTLTLLMMAANVWLSASYAIAAFLCWTLWIGYWLYDETLMITIPLVDIDVIFGLWLTEGQWEQFYYAWSPLYAVAMVLQVYSLSRGKDDAGKRIRRAIIPINWDRVFQPIHNIAYLRITTNNSRTAESGR